jgi:transposase
MCIISKFLCENYDAVLLPDYKSSEMVQTGKKKAQSVTVRKMLTWSYYKFKQIIQAICLFDCYLYRTLHESNMLRIW